MPDLTYDNVPVRVVRDEEQGCYFFGVVIGGAFLPFASRKLGGVDDDLQRAKDEAAAIAAAEPPAPAPPVATSAPVPAQ
jgi:hypothetical protein